MAHFTIAPTREFLRGSFSRDYPPILTIESGDTVRFQTLDAGWGIEPPIISGVPRKKFSPRDPERDDGHALCGPVAIRGAQAGMTLEIRIDAVQPAPWGWTFSGGLFSELNKRLGMTEEESLLRWVLDTEKMIGRDQFGRQLKLRPFMGVMGMPPDLPGIHSTIPPRFCGGNIDCKELVAGSSLFLPIAVAGGLFSVGDGHALQADGEVCSQAIECPMERVDLTFFLHDGKPITTPRAKTPIGWLTLGFHKDLDEAMVIAVNAMLDLMLELYSINRTDAQAMASLVVDLRITQVVNTIRGVHAVLPNGAIMR